MNRPTSSRLPLAGSLLSLIVLAPPSARAAAAAVDDVSRWNAVALRATASSRADPLSESRLLAMVHLAMHDALNVVERRYQPYTFAPAPVPEASPDPPSPRRGPSPRHRGPRPSPRRHTRPVSDAACPRAGLRRRVARSLSQVASGAARQAGVAIGRRAAQAVLARRAARARRMPACAAVSGACRQQPARTGPRECSPACPSPARWTPHGAGDAGRRLGGHPPASAGRPGERHRAVGRHRDRLMPRSRREPVLTVRRRPPAAASATTPPSAPRIPAGWSRCRAG